MWKKLLIAVALLYLAVLMQSSFFAHYSLMGQSPDLVFILFFCFVFFLPIKKTSLATPSWLYQTVFLAGYSGFLHDIFFSCLLGPSIVIFLVIGLSVKKIQSSLSNKRGLYSFAYFIPLFIISFVIFTLLISVLSFFLTTRTAILISASGIVYSLIYDLLFAVLFFYGYKKIIGANKNSKKYLGEL